MVRSAMARRRPRRLRRPVPRYRASSTSWKAASTLAFTSRPRGKTGGSGSAEVMATPLSRGRQCPVPVRTWCPCLGRSNRVGDGSTPVCHTEHPTRPPPPPPTLPGTARPHLDGRRRRRLGPAWEAQRGAPGPPAAPAARIGPPGGGGARSGGLRRRGDGAARAAPPLTAVDAAEVFWALHSDLPREGVGSDATTRTLLALAAPLPASPRALDVGCGSGRASLVLAGAGARVTAVDLHEPFLHRTRAAAARAGLRVAVERASMTALPHPDGTFDLLWCEGAAYLMGVDRALRDWRRLLHL